MPPKKLPWFRVFVNDWLIDTASMTLAQQGAYFRLLCYQWRDGSVPDELEELAGVCGVAVDRFEEEIWSRLSRHFEAADDGGLVNPRLEQERTAWDRRRAERARAGRKGAKARWGNPKGDKDINGKAMAGPRQSHGNPNATAMANDSESESERETESEEEQERRSRSEDPPPSPPYSPPSPQEGEEQGQERDREDEADEDPDPPPRPSLDDITHELAAEFTEHKREQGIEARGEALDVLLPLWKEKCKNGALCAELRTWLGRIEPWKLRTAIRELKQGRYRDEDGEELGWDALPRDSKKALITDTLNPMLKARSPQ